jgi:predicted lipoprotein with Yx(FWY)xxD motif
MRFTNSTDPASLRRALPLLALTALALAGCGSGGDSSTAQGTGHGSATVVTVSDSSGHSVLVDSDGKALYFSDEEKGRILCTSGACGAIWTPLTVPDKNSLTVPPPLTHELGTMARPDGSTQVTLAGRPLYTFSFDHSAGQVNGDGTKDSFDGTDFTWHVATPTGRVVATPTSPSSSSAPSTPYGNGSYNY